MKPDFSTLQLSEEFGRGSYYYHLSAIQQYFAKGHSRWPMRFGVILVSKAHQTKFYVVFKKEKNFDTYLNEYLKKQKLFSELGAGIRKRVKKAQKEFEGISFAQLSNTQLAKKITLFYYFFSELAAMAWVLRSVDRAVIYRLRSFFPADEDFNEIFSCISVSKKLSFAAKREWVLLAAAVKLVQKGGAGKYGIRSAAERIYRSYRHGMLGYYTEPVETLEKYIKQVESYLANDPAKLQREEKLRHRKELLHRKKTLACYRLPREAKLILRAGQESAWYKDFYKFNVNKLFLWTEPLFAAVGDRLGLEAAFVKDLTLDEIIALLEGRKIHMKAVRERIAFSITVAYPGYQDVTVGKEAERFQKKYLSYTSAEKAFAGRVACKGIARGRAVVVLGVKDFGKISPRDVLIVTNTSPDFVPVLKKASAIVAEEGGITAHVSVISRELCIPCVVGVRSITFLLKDGDRVEVDAEKGIVRKL